jgi:hypothetical protein
VLVATLGLLAILVFPALAGAQNEGGRLECANNLRQIGMGSMIFAGENNGILPICTVGSGNAGTSNHLNSITYTYYVFEGTTANTLVPTNATPVQGSYQNAGYLFAAGLAGNGSIFYCPAQWGNPEFGANAYNPLLTTDSSDFVRSSYFYNPRLTNPSTSSPVRRYQKVSQLEPHRLFAVDAILAASGGAVGVSLASIEHIRDHGWNVLFTDGSVQFSRLTQNNNIYFNLITENLSNNENEESYLQYDETFTFLEQDH